MTEKPLPWKYPYKITYCIYMNTARTHTPQKKISTWSFLIILYTHKTDLCLMAEIVQTIVFWIFTLGNFVGG
jgi:hypothetical protein